MPSLLTRSLGSAPARKWNEDKEEREEEKGRKRKGRESGVLVVSGLVS